MIEKPPVFVLQLKETCRVTGARWAVWLERAEKGWNFYSPEILSKARRATLAEEWVDQPGVAAWLAGALSSGRIRSRQAGVFSELLNCHRLYAFPNSQNQELILVGADRLDKISQGFFRVLAIDSPGKRAEQSQLVLLYKELEERIAAHQSAELRLIRSARLAAVGEMAAGIAHELNNPLTTIAGFVELALEDLPTDSPKYADLTLVLREAQRAHGVVRRLLDFSHPTENLRVLVGVNDLVSEVLSLVQHLVKSNGVQTWLEFGPNIPMVSADPSQIKQVILNLIHNALQAMPLGGNLWLYTGLKERDERQGVVISVRDTGEGIHPENLGRIFEPFFTTRPTGIGTGLGLPVSYGIITSHGGFIDVESQEDEGSCFQVWLPVESSDAYDR